MNLPNQLTVARFIMALVFVGLMSFHQVGCYLLAYVLFVAATITDYYDGKIARDRNLITNFGKLLDPVADKVLLVGAFVMLMNVPGLHIPGWTVVAIIAREFLITGIRSLAASGGVIIAADRTGKTKAVVQMIYVFTFFALAIIGRLLVIFQEAADWIPETVEIYLKVLRVSSLVAIVGVAVFTAYSGFEFMRMNWSRLDLGESR